MVAVPFCIFILFLRSVQLWPPPFPDAARGSRARGAFRSGFSHRVGAVGAQVKSFSLPAPERRPFVDVPEFLHPAVYVPVFGDYESSCCKHPERCLCEDWSWVLWDKCPAAQCWAVPFGGLRRLPWHLEKLRGTKEEGGCVCVCVTLCVCARVSV